MVTCKSFNALLVKLFDALVLLTQKLCMQYVDPVSIKGSMACRLITPDKGDGSVGVGKVVHQLRSEFWVLILSQGEQKSLLPTCSLVI